VGWSSIANHVMLGLVIKLFFILIQRRVNLLCDREKEILTWEQMQKWTLPFLNYARKNIFSTKIVLGSHPQSPIILPTVSLLFLSKKS
jgi:hypothetical protein